MITNKILLISIFYKYFNIHYLIELYLINLLINFAGKTVYTKNDEFKYLFYILKLVSMTNNIVINKIKNIIQYDNFYVRLLRLPFRIMNVIEDYIYYKIKTKVMNLIFDSNDTDEYKQILENLRKKYYF